jgi:hypothetical protein
MEAHALTIAGCEGLSIPSRHSKLSSSGPIRASSTYLKATTPGDTSLLSPFEVLAKL